MRGLNWTFWSCYGIRILKLNGHRSSANGEIHLLHHAAQICTSFGYREVAALFTLRGRPSEKLDRIGAAAGPNGILHVGVRPSLVQLVIKRRNDVFPWLIERDDPLSDPLGRVSEKTPIA